MGSRTNPVGAIPIYLHLLERAILIVASVGIHFMKNQFLCLLH